jgi:hypothetical protein
MNKSIGKIVKSELMQSCSIGVGEPSTPWRGGSKKSILSMNRENQCDRDKEWQHPHPLAGGGKKSIGPSVQEKKERVQEKDTPQPLEGGVKKEIMD